MITEDYVSFETAKLLKEKGFNEPCRLYYDKYHGYVPIFVEDSKLREYGYKELARNDQNSISDFIASAPPLYVAMKWLRKKGFHIFVPLEIDYDEDERGDKWYHDAAYYPEIRRVSDGKIMYDDGSLYAEPEQAYEVAIKYCLENLI